MRVFFNNCSGRDHVKLYGQGAFYDLDTTGRQSTQAKNLDVGQECVVATPATDGQITFSRFSFLHEEIKPDDIGSPCRVFFGPLLGSETLLKAEAAGNSPYSAFFNKNGHFKRHSVIEG